MSEKTREENQIKDDPKRSAAPSSASAAHPREWDLTPYDASLIWISSRVLSFTANRSQSFALVRREQAAQGMAFAVQRGIGDIVDSPFAAFEQHGVGQSLPRAVAAGELGKHLGGVMRSPKSGRR